MDDIFAAYASADCDSVDLLPSFEFNFEILKNNDEESVSPSNADVVNDAKIGEFIEQNKNITLR